MGGAEQSHKILVVDDDEHVLVALEALLENQGYETTTAWSGQKALKLPHSSVFGLVLLEDHLPDVATDPILWQLQTMLLRPSIILTHTARLPP